MIIVDKNASRSEQLQMQVKRCYDDYCFYNRFEKDVRESFVKERMVELTREDFVLPYLPVYLTTACSLNCEKCNNLMPMFHGRASDFLWEKTKASLKKILSVSKEIIFCELVGGEPFLNRNLEEILDFVAGVDKIRQIIIVTNGTVIPEERIIQKLAEYRVIVRVSDYGLFEKMSAFVAALDKHNVNVRIQQDMKWNDPGGIDVRGRTHEDLRKQYNMCEFSLKCKYLCEDKLFTCARAASLYHLGLFDSDKDILGISDQTTVDDIRNFYLQDEGDICDYCDLFTADGKMIPAAVQVGDKQFRHSDYTVISNYEFNHYKKMTQEYENLLAKTGGVNGCLS